MRARTAFGRVRRLIGGITTAVLAGTLLIALPATPAAAAEPWSGTVELAVSRTQVDVHDTSAVITATARNKVPLPYFLSIYDDKGQRIAYCNAAYSGCGTADATTIQTTINVSNDATRTFTAYVSLDIPETSIPINDVRATSNTSRVQNRGWNGSVQLTRTQSVGSDWMVVTALADSVVQWPYYVSIYDDLGRLVTYCGNGVYSCAMTDTTGTQATIHIPSNSTRTYTAYVSQDLPGISLPVNDVRAVSGRVTTSGNGPTSAGETAGGSNPSVACSARCHGDPVNSVTGEFWESSTDLSVGSGSPALAFQRSFATSRNQVDGPLGWGWTTNFDMLMSVPVGVTGTLQDAGQVQVRQENGSLVAFTRTGDGRFVAPARVQAT